MKQDPAILAMEALGGSRALATLLEKDRSVVNRWKLPREKGGADGRIPASNLFPIWCALIKGGICLSLEELVFTEEERKLISSLRTKYQDKLEGLSSYKSKENMR
jgi:hypothetical protein